MTYLTNRRASLAPATVSPARAGAILVVGDSIAKQLQTGLGQGGILEEIAYIGAFDGPVELWNAGYGGFKLLDDTGTSRFLDLNSLADEDGMSDAKAVLAAAGAVDALIISLGTNDLADVVPSANATPGYDSARIVQGMQALIKGLRDPDLADDEDGDGEHIPVIVLVPGRDRSVTNKAGGGQTWRQAMIDLASYPNVHLLDFYDVDIADSVHPGPAGQYAIGLRIGRLISKFRQEVLQAAHEDTVVSASAGSITLRAGAPAVDTIYNNATVQILSGTGAGQSRTVATYDGGMKTATVTEDWTPSPDNSSTYRITPRIQVGGPPMIASIAKTDAFRIKLNFSVPSGQTLVQVPIPSGWRVEDSATGEELPVARIDWIDSNEANLVLQKATTSGMRLFAPYDLCQGMTAEGVIRTREGSGSHAPGFALKSFTGETP